MIRQDGGPLELYDLESDVGETTNVIEKHPEVVTRLRALADRCRQDLGDARNGIKGAGCRPSGWVDDPKTLTTLDPDDPLVNAAYD